MTDATAPRHHRDETLGLLMVAGAALVWSFGGAIARSIETTDGFAIVFWRSVWATVFLVGFLLLREGAAGAWRQARAMGLAGVAVGLCFTTASVSFVLALAHTTVANILLIQAGVPLIAAAISFVVLGERPSLATLAAIAAVIFGVFVMVSGSLTGAVSPVGDGLALVIAVAFATAMVVTRRHAHVAMLPAVALGTTFAAVVGGTLAGSLAVSLADQGFLFAFGALNLGLGLAFFVTGARLVPATIAALVSTLEPVLGPVWVFFTHGEVPSARTLVGGAIILAALVAHILVEARRGR